MYASINSWSANTRAGKEQNCYESDSMALDSLYISRPAHEYANAMQMKSLFSTSKRWKL